MNYFNLKIQGHNEPQARDVATSNTSISAVSTGGEIAPSTDGLQFAISEYFNCKDNVPKAKAHTWKSFCEAFGKHPVQSKKDGPAWSPLSYIEGGTRNNENVDQVFMAVIDVDNGTPHEVVLERFAGYACLAHSSYTHSLDLQKYRIILPLAAPVKSAEWRPVWARINQLAGGCNDASTKDPARLYYKPAHPPGTDHHFVKIQNGALISVDDLPELARPIAVHPLTFQPRGVRKQLVEIDGIESSEPDQNLEEGLAEVVKRCAFMKFASAAENQGCLEEPQWMAMISNACRFEKSQPWIHAASEHYPEYSETKTNEKILHLQYGSPPITCQRIREVGFQNCPSGGCHRPNGEVTKSPAGLQGWMFHRQLTEAETVQDQIPSEYALEDFTVKPSGVYQRKTKNDDDYYVRLCSRIDVTALTRDHDSSNWGMELSFADPDGLVKKWALPKELLASAGDSYRASLLKMGATIEPSKDARAGLAAYLVAAMPEARALSVRQPGWFKDLFVLPDAVYGRSDERVVFQTSDPDEIKRFSQKGSLKSWQQNIALPCQGNSRAVASICIGLAPPLLYLLGEDNGGFHLRGNSSIGKSVCLFLGSSVWGSNGLIRTWNMTVNGLEGVATMHNDVLLPLDEMGQANGKDVGDAAYMLGNGQGKGRATKDGDARTAKRWRNIVLSSGEKSISDLMAEDGQMAMAGQEVRMVEIAADAGCNYGVFEDIHDAKSSQVFAEQLKHAVAEHHGYAGRAFVELLANPELQPKLIEKLKALIQRFVDTYVPPEATGQVGRVGRRFGLVAAAGELCIELGILPWPEGEAFEASRKCFMSWIDLRGGVGNHEADQAIAQVRCFMERHGESRFTAWDDTTDNNGMGKTINRAGLRRVTDDGRTEYFILPEVYRSDVCKGLNPKYVTSILAGKGFVAKDRSGKPQVEMRLPGIGKMRVYHLTADFMGGGVSQTENRETVVRQPTESALAMKYNV